MVRLCLGAARRLHCCHTVLALGQVHALAAAAVSLSLALRLPLHMQVLGQELALGRSHTVHAHVPVAGASTLGLRLAAGLPPALPLEAGQVLPLVQALAGNSALLAAAHSLVLVRVLALRESALG